MVIHNLMRGIATLLLISGIISGLFAHQTAADTPPWEMSKPKGMTTVHQDNAIAARAIQNGLPKGGFGIDDLHDVEWDKRNSILRTIPISNMTTANLTSLLNGKYHIRKAVGQDLWTVWYFAPDGVTHFCSSTNGRYREKTLDRYVTSTPIGLAGILHRDPKKRDTSKKNKAWPIIGNSDKGLLYAYSWTGRKWVAEPGWVQKEYAAAFAEHCPNLPRTAKVNNNQLGDTFFDLVSEATAIYSFKTAFKNDLEDPFTASMYYWLYPPE